MGTDSAQSTQVFVGVLEFCSNYGLELLQIMFNLPDYKDKSKP